MYKVSSFGPNWKANMGNSCFLWARLLLSFLLWNYKTQWIVALYDWCMGGSHQLFLIVCRLTTNAAAIGSPSFIHCLYKEGERYNLFLFILQWNKKKEKKKERKIIHTIETAQNFIRKCLKQRETRYTNTWPLKFLACHRNFNNKKSGAVKLVLWG